MQCTNIYTLWHFSTLQPHCPPLLAAAWTNVRDQEDLLQIGAALDRDYNRLRLQQPWPMRWVLLGYMSPPGSTYSASRTVCGHLQHRSFHQCSWLRVYDLPWPITNSVIAYHCLTMGLQLARGIIPTSRTGAGASSHSPGTYSSNACASPLLQRQQDRSAG